MQKSISRTDLIAGVIVILIGAFAFVEALGYPIGTTRRMGPGYFPIAVSTLMVVFGLAIIFIEGWRRRPDGAESDEAAAVPGGFRLRSVLANGVAFLAFGAMIEGLGLFISAAVAVLIASLADPRTPLLKAVIIALVVATASSLLFVYGLRLQMEVFP